MLVTITEVRSVIFITVIIIVRTKEISKEYR